eukprot:6759982-Heterocapsa_arctica.AAC.1
MAIIFSRRLDEKVEFGVLDFDRHTHMIMDMDRDAMNCSSRSVGSTPTRRDINSLGVGRQVWRTVNAAGVTGRRHRVPTAPPGVGA